MLYFDFIDKINISILNVNNFLCILISTNHVIENFNMNMQWATPAINTGTSLKVF